MDSLLRGSAGWILQGKKTCGSWVAASEALSWPTRQLFDRVSRPPFTVPAEVGTSGTIRE